MYLKKEKKNEDIDPLKVKVVFNTSEGLKKSGASYLKLTMELSEKQTLETKFNIDKDYSVEFKLDEKLALKLLDKKDMKV